MKRRIIVIDDFYKEPDAIRKLALNSSYLNSKSNDGYNGYKSIVSTKTKDSLMNKIAKVLGLGITYQVSRQGDFKSLHQIQFKNKTTFVHFDLCDWSGVLCLSDPKKIRGYTSFWRHNLLRVDGFDDINVVAKICAKKKCHVQDLFDLIDKDSAKMSRWTELSRIHHVYNRLILFRGNMFHASSEGFGNSLENSKLTQTFFFNELTQSSQVNCEKGWKSITLK